MKNLTNMLNELLYTSSSNKKIDIIIYYLNSTPLEDRGFGIALLIRDTASEYLFVIRRGGAQLEL